MEKMKVRELMRPIDEFPCISSQATPMEAVEALENYPPWTSFKAWS